MEGEPKTNAGEPTWIRWIPRPALGLPCFLLVAAALAVLSAHDPSNAMLISLLALPVPFLAMCWGRLPSYVAIASIFLTALVMAPHAHGVAPFVERVAIQVVVVALIWEVVRAAANSQAAAAAELVASEARHRLIVETLNVLPFEFDPASRRFTWVGPQAERLLGYPSPDWLRADFWSEHLHPEDRERAVSFCAAAAERGEDHEFEYRMVGADGQVRWIHDVVTIAAPGAHGSRLRGVMVDISDLKQAEAERRLLETRALEAERLGSLGMLAGGVAHDFNNLLTTVLCNATLAAAHLPEGHPARANVEDLTQAAERGAELTELILAYTGQKIRKAQVHDLSRVVRESLRTAATSMPKEVAVELDLRRGLPVRVDTGQIRQALVSMVNNAAEAFDGGCGTIRIATRRRRSPAGVEAYIEVSDDGCGMGPEVVRHMFDPFFTTKRHGRGLGLAAVHGIARGHGGDVEVDSAPGSGTRVRFLLPQEASARTSIQVPGLAPRASSSSESGTVLVVDDEPAVRSAARRALERHGYVVHEAGDGLEALGALKGDRAIDAMVLDLTMPRLSGVETLRRVRGDRPSLPVVLVSGYAQGHHVDLDASGPVRFLRKPYRASELAAEVDALLGSDASPTKPWSHP